MALTKAKASNILLTTPAASSNDVTPATTEYVTTALANMVDSAPSTLNTLNELAAALGDDANFSTTVTNSIATKLPLAGGTMTGNIAHASDFTIDAGGNITLNAAGDIILDADGDDWKFHEGGTAVFEIKHESHGVDFLLNTGNEDWRFKGSDDGTTITALHLDMSEAGAASFNAGATFGGGVTVNSGHVNIDSGLSYQWGDSHERIEQSDGNIEFFTNNSQAMTLSGSNLGIGTTSPTRPLTVAGSMNLTGTGTYIFGGDNEILAGQDSGGYYFATGNSQDVNKTIYIGDNASSINFATGNSEKMRIASSGAVLMGTTTQLHSSQLTVDNPSGQCGITLSETGTSVTALWGLDSLNAIGTRSNHAFNIRSNDTNRMTFDSSGNVGIGTTSPGNKLTVNGGFSSNNFRAVGTGQTYASGNRNMFIGTGAGVASYASYSGGSGSPTTYDWSLEVGDGSRGFQITADWLSTTGAGPYYVRTLRDCCQNWSSYHTLNITAVSDRRTKTDIENITSPRTIIDALQGITYMPVNPDGTIGHIDRENPDPDNLQENMVEREREYGYIAQDVVDIIPSVVDYHEKLDEPNEHGWANAYMLRYERLVPVLTEALKECYSKIDALETKITELEG